MSKLTRKQVLLFLSLFLISGAILTFTLPLFAAGGSTSGGHFPWKNWAFNMFNFLVFVGILWWKAVPAMQDFFAKRREELVTEINAAKALREEAKEKLVLFETKLQSLEKERQVIMDEYHEQGGRERDRLVDEAKKQVEKMKEDAEMIISQETRKAVLAIEKQAVDEAIGLAITKLTSTMNDSAQNRLVDDFVNELRAMD